MAIILDKIVDLIAEGPIVAVLLCILLVVYLIHLKNFYAGTPPGPWGLPIFGYLFKISEQPFKQFASLSKKYGDIFSLTLGSRYVVILNHYDVIKEAFIKDGDIFAGKPLDGIPKEFGEHKTVFVTDGDVWKEQRRFLLSTFKDFGFGRSPMEQYIQDEAKLTIEKLITTKNKPIDVTKYVYLAVMNVISFLVFGQRFTKDDKHILDNFNYLNEIVIKSSQFSFLEAFPTIQQLLKPSPSFRTFIKAKENLYSFSDSKIEDHKKSFDLNNIRDLIDSYLMKQKELISNDQKANKVIYNEDFMRANVLNTFLAGTDTTGSTLIWALKLLALSPEAQVKIQQEIDVVIGQERPPSMNDKLQMPFTESVLLEIQRFISFVPFTFYHRTTNETFLRGYRIPKDTLVLANLWSVHYDQRIWENPFEFKPDRFLTKEGTLSNLREYVIPFSIGKRNCIGESIAKMEIFLFLLCFLQKLTFRATEIDNNLTCTEVPFRKLDSCTLIVTPRN